MELEGIEDVYELSSIQEGLLFHNLYSPGSGIYLEQVTMTMRGPLDVAAYQQAWQTIVNRHSVLRTSFHWEGVDKALQVVRRDAPFPIEVLDWRDADAEERRRREEEFARADRMRGFDYTDAPLMRGHLLRLTDTDWRFFWSFSHLLMDGWSFGLAFFELAEIYTALAEGRTPKLEPARPYRDYLAWWKRQDRTPTEKFWAGYLTGHVYPDALEVGVPPHGELPPGEPTHAVLPTPELTDQMPRLSDFARAHGLTLNTLMQGAWTIVLSRYLGVEDVMTGSTGTHRPASLTGAERIMGPMLATMPVRATVDPHAELVPWLRDLQNGMAQAREHADISLPDLRRLAGLSGNRPLFEVDLAFENVPVPDLKLGEVQIVESTYDGRPHFPITMIVMPGEGMPVPRVVYDQTRFTESAIRRMVGHFAQTLDNMIAYPELHLGEIDIMPADEWQLVIDEWQHVEEQPASPTLHEIFARRAAETPDAVALSCGDERLTYAQLARRANRLAHHLRERGAGPEVRVGLCLQRSVDMMVAILGTLTAGAAYVPLDLGQPGERMAYILTDSQASILVTHAPADPVVPAFDGTVVHLDRDADAIAAQPDTAPDSGATPDSLAYVIYTSGSTGRPKGVLLPHSNVVRLVTGSGTEGRFVFRADDVWSMFHSYAFDVSVFETWGAFINGAKLVVVPHDTIRNPEALLALLRRERVTVFSQTPSAFRQFAAAALADADGGGLALRYVVFAGEYLDVPALRPWLERYGDDAPQLINMYGITETTVHSTWYRVTKADLDGPVRSNVGRPLPDLRIYLLDNRKVPVPPGIRGEIWVSGPGVARGYQNLPELTNERFVPDWYAGEPGPMMYRSGDLARFTDSGDLEFLGRADFQVKIRGFRVELGEIEAVLRAQPGVADVVVLARGDGDDTRLVGYVIPTEGTVPEEDGTEQAGELAAALREAARVALPEYMVPAHVVVLRAFPLTANGKIDRNALPEPDSARPVLATEYVPPRSDTEKTIAAVWQEILGVEQVGVFDDFFALGGHSLLATRVTFKLRAATGSDVPVRALFDRPTVAALAELLDSGAAGAAATAKPTITRRARVVQQV